MTMLSEARLPKETINSESFIKDRLREQAWAWFNERREDPVLTVRVMFLFKLDVTLGDLEGLWEQVFGPEPKLFPLPD